MAIAGIKEAGDSAVPLLLELPEFIADHRLLRCVGEGSYGKVFLARNELTSVYRAVKIVFRDAFRDAKPYQREFEAICRFEPISRNHPGFVQILQVGKIEGAFYYIMELADDVATGPSIDPEGYRPRTLNLIRGQMLPIDRCIEIGSSLAASLSVLHGNNLIHRDVKPSNIIFVNNAPKLADIGLVAQIDEANSIVGTAGFMPPEGPVSPQSDIFSLGKVLYEIATGKDRCEFPELPDDITTESTLHLELNQILLKACEPKPERRYRTAEDLRKELEVLQAGRSIKKLRQVEKRLRVLRWSFAGFIAIALVAFVIYRQVQAQRQEEARERQRLAGSILAQGTIEMRDGYLSRALSHFLRAAELDPRDLRTHQLRIGSVQAGAPHRYGPWRSGPAAEFSSDGSWIVVPNSNSIRILETLSGREIQEIDLAACALARLSPDRTRLAAVSSNLLHIVARTDFARATYTFGHPVVDFAFSPVDHRLAVSLSDGQAFFVEADGTQIPFSGNLPVLSVGFDSKGEMLFTTCGRSGMPPVSHLRSARTGEVIGRTFNEKLPYRGVFSPDGKLVVLCAWGKAVPLHVPSGELAGDIMDNDDAVMDCAFSPNGKMLATTSFDGAVRLWEIPGFNPVKLNHRLDHRDRPTRVVFLNDNTIAARCMDGETYVWKLGSNQEKPGTLIPYEPEPDRLRSSNANGAVWAKGRTIFAQIGRRDFQIDFPTVVETVALSPDATAFAAGSRDSLFEVTHARLYRVNRLEHPIDLPHKDGINYLTFSHSGDRLVTCSEDYSAMLWDVKTGKRLGKPMRHSWQVVGAAFSDDDKWVATIGWDDACVVWDASNGDPLTVPVNLGSKLKHVAFAPGNNAVLIHSTNSMYRLELPFAPLPLTQYTNSLAFDPLLDLP